MPDDGRVQHVSAAWLQPAPSWETRWALSPRCPGLLSSQTPCLPGDPEKPWHKPSTAFTFLWEGIDGASGPATRVPSGAQKVQELVGIDGLCF